MTLAHFFEKLLLRDVISYVLPGTMILLLLMNCDGSDVYVDSLFSLIKEDFGALYAALLFGGIAYVVSYLISTLLFYFRGHVDGFRRPKITEIRPEIKIRIKTVFGKWTEQASLRHLNNICLHYVELQEPDYYYEKFERRVILRNLEVNMAGVFFVIAICVFVFSEGWCILCGVLPLAVAILLLLSSKIMDASIDKLSFVAFYVVSGLHLSNAIENKNKAQT